ncbi:MAG: hypothetical protein KDI79_15980 [Anaerolineae bacterium]|nr:hypothetical protein [Anaerolineae bacterium]
MSNRDVFEITLKLNNKEALFKKPKITPFSQDYQIHSYTSGIEFISDELYADTSYKRIHVTLILPENETEAGLEQEVKVAVKRYCGGRLKNIEHDIQATRWRGIRALFVSFIALFVFIGASKLVHDDNSLILQVVSEGLSVAGWVALWFPLELLSFTVWQHRLEKKIYTLLMEMDVTIRV